MSDEKADDEGGGIDPTSRTSTFFCGLGDAVFKNELKRIIETKRDRLWMETEGLRQAIKELLGS